jgi:hypothetical protein
LLPSTTDVASSEALFHNDKILDDVAPGLEEATT